MAYQFNVFTGQLDIVGGAATTSWKTPVTTQSALPASGNTSGDVRVTSDTGIAYEWSGSAWAILNGVYPTAVSGTSTPDGVSVDGSNNLTLHVADATNPGLLSTTTQTIAGNKTFNGSVNLSPLTNSTVLVLDGSNNIVSSSTTSTELGYVHGVTSAIQTQLNATEKTANKGVVNGYASLDSSGHIPLSQLPSSLVEYQGTWDASTNTPTLSNSSGTYNTSGFFFIVSTGGTVNFGAGNITFNAGDWVLFNGSIWEQAVQATVVQSVNGQVGVVTVNAINQLIGDVATSAASGSQSEVATIQANTVTNSKLAQMAANTVKANITGSTANATDASLGTVIEATSAVLTLTGWTDSTIGSPTIQVKLATTTQSGYLSSTDWNTFNNKQSAGSFATTTLNNLGTTAVNANILPGATNTLTLGGTGKIWSSVNANTVVAPNFENGGVGNLIQMNLLTGVLIDSGNQTSISWSGTNRLLNDTGGTTQLSWSTSGVEYNQLTATTVPYLNASKVLTSSAVTPTQLGFLSSVTGGIASKSAGDLNETSFSASNNISSAANVTGLSFSNSTVGSFEALVQVFVNATTSLRQTFNIQGTQIGAGGWEMSQTTSGDESGFIFTINSSGQLQYVNNNYSGFVAATVKFRAISLSL